MTSSWHTTHLSCPQFSHHTVKVREKKKKNSHKTTQTKKSPKHQNNDPPPNLNTHKPRNSPVEANFIYTHSFHVLFKHVASKYNSLFLKEKVSEKKKDRKDQLKFVNWIKFVESSRSRNEVCETPDETNLERTRFPKADIILKLEIIFLWLLKITFHNRNMVVKSTEEI